MHSLFIPYCVFFRWPDIYRMKVRDKNFGIETPGETIYFKMVSPAMKHAAAK